MRGERKRAKRAKRKSRNSGPLGQGKNSRFLGNGNAPRSAVLHLPGASEVGRVDTYCAMTLMLIRPPGAAPRRPGVPGASRLHAGPQIPHQLPPQIHFSFLFKFFKLFLSSLPPPIGGESAVEEEEQKSTCCSSKSYRANDDGPSF